MDNALTLLVFFMVFAMVCSLYYKMYQQSKLDDQQRRGSIGFLFQKNYSIWPVSRSKAKSENDKAIIRKANRALVVFWVLLVLIIICLSIKSV